MEIGMTTRMDINYENFVPTSFEELKVGDLVKTTTMTFSQKYMFYPGYEEYNMTKIGVLIEKDNENPGYSKLKQIINDETKETILYSDPGTSGTVYISKYCENS